MKLLTIFTPTFNRAYILAKLYTSLVCQTSNNFVWLIIDDGSTDYTEELVKQWLNESKIDIVYYKQKNQGKHAAHNKGVELCNTELFFCVDSDDYLTNNAVQIIESLNHEERSNKILGFYLRKGDFSGKPLGENWPQHSKYIKLNELYQRYGFRGEAAIVLKKEMIKAFSFPQFGNEKFLTETVFYDQINDIAPLRVDNHVCYLFEYREDGYTQRGLKLQFENPIGVGFNYLNHIRHTNNMIEQIKLMGQFYAWNSIFNVDEPLYKKIYIPLHIRIVGFLLKPHYMRLYNKSSEIL